MEIQAKGGTITQDTDVSTLAAGAIVTLLGKVVGRSLHAAIQIILARSLGPSVYGLYALGWTVFRLLGIIVPLGLDSGMIHFAPGYWKDAPDKFKGLLHQTFGLAMSSGAVAGVAIFFLAPWLADVFDKPSLTPVLRVFSVGFPLLAGLRVASATIQVSKCMKYVIYGEEVGRTAANLLLIGLFFLLGWGVLGSVAAAVISFGVALILSFYYVLKLFPHIYKAKASYPITLRNLLSFSLPASLASLSTLFTVWASRLFIGYFRSATEVGIYQALSESSILFTIILSAMNSIFAPMIAQLYHQGELTRLNQLYKISTKWGLYLAIPIFLTIAFASQDFMVVIFGEVYERGGLPLFILVIGQLINVATGAVGFILIMTGKQNWWMTISVASLLTNVILNWFLVPRLGLVGAALATCATISVMYLSGLLVVRRSLNLWPYDRRYLKGAITTVITVAALFLLHSISLDKPILNLILTAGIAAVVFYGILFMLGLDTEDWEIIHLALARFRGKR